MQDKKIIQQEDFEWIERYFELDLTEEELKNITIRLQKDKAFRAQFREYEYSHALVEEIFDKDVAAEKKAFQESWETAFRVHKEELAKEEEGNGKVVAMRWRKYFVMAAASVALLFGLFWFLKNNSSKVSVPQMAATYWQSTAQESPEMVRGNAGQDDFDAAFEQAVVAYLDKDFTKVHALLENIPQGYLGFNEVLILKGKAFTEMQNFGDAVGAFDHVFARPELGSVDRALWFQALVFLKIGEVEKAKGNLEKIVVQDYPLGKKAEELLEKLGD